MLIPVARNVFKWKSNDPELGIEQVGHALISAGSIVAVDPPMVPGLADAIKVLGKPAGVILTNYSHIRGGSALARSLGVDLYIPDLKGTERRNPAEEIRLHHLEKAIKYGPNTKLPLGIKAHSIRPETDDGQPVVDEMILQFDEFLVAGDSAWGNGNKIVFFPAQIMPDPEGKRKAAVQKSMEKLAKETMANSLLGGHWDDLIGSLQQQF